MRARNRLSKFLLRHGWRPPIVMGSWTKRHMAWIKREVHFEQPAQEITLLDYIQEVDHGTSRMERLERAIDEVVKSAPAEMQAVIGALQALRGIAQVSAVTILSEVGVISRFSAPRQLMGYSGLVAREHSSGERNWRGGQRRLERQTGTTRSHYEDRQCPSTPSSHRGCMGLPTPTHHWSHPAPTSARSQGRSKRDCLESPASFVYALSPVGGPRKEQAASHHRDRTRVVGIHLGHRSPGWSRASQSKDVCSLEHNQHVENKQRR